MKFTKKLQSSFREIRHSAHCAILCLVCILFAGCNTKQNVVYELLKLRTEIKEHCSEYTQADWENAIEKYTRICEELDEMQFTQEEHLEINQIKGEIAGYATSVAAQKITDGIERIADDIESFADGFSNSFQTPKSRR